MEKVFTTLYKPIAYAFPTFWSVPTSTVAMAMLNRTVLTGGGGGEGAVGGEAGVETLENKQIHQAAKCE